MGLLEDAARGGHPYAMFNLGVAHLFGYGVPGMLRDPDLAAEWFAACGLPEGMMAQSMHARSKGFSKKADALEARAKRLGWGTSWRVMARMRSGHGGSTGINLNLDWPFAENGQRPPQW